MAKKGSELNQHNSQIILGNCYLNGKGVEKNYKKAF